MRATERGRPSLPVIVFFLGGLVDNRRLGGVSITDIGALIVIPLSRVTDAGPEETALPHATHRSSPNTVLFALQYTLYATVPTN
jgi:hypothetical protein